MSNLATDEPPKPTIRVFVSSPGDVTEERGRAFTVIKRLGEEYASEAIIKPDLYETAPLQAGATPQRSVTDVTEMDIVVGILWGRLGTPLPPEYRRPDGTGYESGTVYELETAIEAYRRTEAPDVFVYRKTKPVPLPVDGGGEQREQMGRVERFFQGFVASDGSLTGSYTAFEEAREFETQLYDHLKSAVELRAKRAGLREAAWDVAEKGSPFQGLQPFERQHRAVFFGRDRDLREVESQLRTQAESGLASVIVAGPSGAGKSSLVRCGLLADLTRPGRGEESVQWRTAMVRPSDSPESPMASLVDGLCSESAVPELVGRTGHLRDGRVDPIQLAATIADILRVDRAAEEETRLLLIVDQLEEALQFAGETADKTTTEFAAALRTLAASGAVWVVATLRNDFYDRFTAVPDLKTLKAEAGWHDLAMPGPDQIGEMIRRPTFAAGLTFESNRNTGARLDDAIRDEAVANPASLPLLAFTLRQLHETAMASGQTMLTFDTYDEIGRLEGSIAEQANRIFDGLPKETRDALPRVFRRLVDVDAASGRIRRRRAFRDDVLAGPDGTVDEPAAALVDRFVSGRTAGDQSRLLTATQIAGRAAIEVSHEALLTHWRELTDWIQSEQELLLARSRFEQQARRWDQDDRPRDLLLGPGKPLQEGQSVREAGLIAQSEEPLLGEYLRQSRRANRWRIARQVMGVAALAVAAVAAGLFAVQADAARDEAVQQKAEAVRQEGIAIDRTKKSLETLSSVIFEVERTLAEAPGQMAVRRRILEIASDRLAAITDESATGNPALERLTAAALSQRSDLQSRLGDLSKAKKLAAKGTRILNRLVKLQPDSIVAQRDLAVSHGQMGSLELSDDNAPAAREYFLKALAIDKKLAKREPDSVIAQRDLSVSYNRMGTLKFSENDAVAARGYFSKGLLIAERLAKHQPDDVQAQRDVAVSYGRMGVLESSEDDAIAAQDYFLKALVIAKRLAKLEPNNVTAQRDLSICYERLGDRKRSDNNAAAARKYFLQALVIVERLAKLEPDNVMAQRDLAVSYADLGNLERSENNSAAAREYFLKALPIRERLAKLQPESIRAQRNLSICHERFGELERSEDNIAAARDAFRKALTIRERLAKLQPESTKAQWYLSARYNQQGDLELTADDTFAARDYFLKAAAIRERLSERQPKNVETQKDLLVIYYKLETLERSEGNVTVAREYFLKSLTIMEQLAKLQPDNAEAQRELLTKYGLIAGLMHLEGDAAAAMDYALKGLAIAERFTKLQPDSSEAQTDLFASLYLCADLDAASNPELRRTRLTRALRILQSLEKKNQLTAKFADFPSIIQSELDAMDAPLTDETNEDKDDAAADQSSATKQPSEAQQPAGTDSSGATDDGSRLP